MHDAHIASGPVDEHGFAVNKRALDRAEVAAIGRNGAVIAHHEVAIGRHDHFGHGAVSR